METVTNQTSMKTGDSEVKKQERDSNILIEASTGKVFKVMSEPYTILHIRNYYSKNTDSVNCF